MRRLTLSVLLATLVVAPATAVAAGSPPGTRPALVVDHRPAELVAFRSRLHFGGSRSRGFGYGYYNRRRPSLLHRVVRTAIWLYVAHLFFSHGGLSILLWIIIIGLVVSLMRRRRRRYVY